MKPAVRSAIVRRLMRRHHLVSGFDSDDALINMPVVTIHVYSVPHGKEE